jgi:hypothetical protein
MYFGFTDGILPQDRHEVDGPDCLRRQLAAATAEIDRLTGIVASYGLTTADGVVVRCTSVIFAPSATDETIYEVFVGGPSLDVLDEEGGITGVQWDLIANCYSTRTALAAAKESKP